MSNVTQLNFYVLTLKGEVFELNGMRKLCGLKVCSYTAADGGKIFRQKSFFNRYKVIIRPEL
jgi:hypothetical protein